VLDEISLGIEVVIFPLSVIQGALFHMLLLCL